MNNKIIELMKNYYNEDNSRIKHYVNLPLNEFGEKNTMNSAFIIFTYEAFIMGQAKDILNRIQKIGGYIVDFVYYPGIDEYQLVQHYKYHNPRPNATDKIYGYSSIVPSIGWPMVRKRFGKPLIACVVLGDDNSFNENMLRLKGKSDPSVCQEGQVRYTAPNKVFTLLHSSDDHYSAVRESILFLGEERYLKLINTEPEKLKKNTVCKTRMIKLFANSCAEHYLEPNDVIRKIESKIYWHLANKYWDEMVCNFGVKKIQMLFEQNMLSKFKQKIEAMECVSTDLLYQTIGILRKKKRIEEGIVDKIMSELKKLKLFDSEWEESLIESELLLVYLDQLY